MAELDAHALVLRGIEAMEGSRSETARMRDALTDLRAQVDGLSAAEAKRDQSAVLYLERLDSRLVSIELQLRRREDREAREDEARHEVRKGAWDVFAGGVKAVWSDATFRAILAAAVIGWLGVQADLIRLLPGASPP